MLLWIIGFSILGSVGTVAGAALMLLFPDGTRRTAARAVPARQRPSPRFSTRETIRSRASTAS